MAQALIDATALTTVGLNSDVVNEIEAKFPGSTARCINSACAWGQGILKARYNFPLVSWDDDLREALAVRAGYLMLCLRGFDPEKGSGKALLQRLSDATDWLQGVAARVIHPEITDTAPENVAPVAISDEPRGW